MSELTDFRVCTEFFERIGYQTHAVLLEDTNYFYATSDNSDEGYGGLVSTIGYDAVEFYAEFDDRGSLVRGHMHSHVCEDPSWESVQFMDGIRKAIYARACCP